MKLKRRWAYGVRRETVHTGYVLGVRDPAAVLLITFVWVGVHFFTMPFGLRTIIEECMCVFGKLGIIDRITARKVFCSGGKRKVRQPT